LKPNHLATLHVTGFCRKRKPVVNSTKGEKKLSFSVGIDISQKSIKSFNYLSKSLLDINPERPVFNIAPRGEL
jgi:hypothetical protein